MAKVSAKELEKLKKIQADHKNNKKKYNTPVAKSLTTKRKPAGPSG